MINRYCRAALLAALIFPLASAPSAQAGGFQTLPPSTRALGMAGAVTATTTDASAAWFNPGALGMLDSAEVSLGASFLRVGRVFSSATTGSNTTANGSLVAAPHFYAAAPFQRVVLGLSVNSPYGYDTQWPADWQGRALVQTSRIRTLYAQPTVAYKVSDRFSVGAGAMLVGADYELTRALGQFAGATTAFKSSGTGIGFNVGIQGRAGDAVAFGITYRSAVKVTLNDGEATYNGLPASQVGFYPASSTFNSVLRLPGMLAAGISNRVNDKLLLNFTFELTGWSVLDSLNIDFKDGAFASERVGRRYEDAMAFRIGAEYTHSDALMLRAGIYYDESPVRDQNITADLPDANLFGGTIGASYALGRHLRLDGAYTYALSASRNARADAFNVQVPAIAGSFRNNQHGGSVNLTYRF